MAEFWIDPTGSNGDGTEPTPFNSLLNAVNATLAAFNSATEDYIYNCLDGADPATDTGLITINSTSATPRVMRFIATGANRHTGVRGTGYRHAQRIRMNSTNVNVTVELVGINTDNIHVDNAANTILIARDCFIADSFAQGVFCGGGTVQLVNTAIVGASSANVLAENNNGSGIIEAINCTSVDAGSDGGFVAQFGGVMTAINCYSGGNAGADFAGITSPTNCRSEDGTQSTTTAAYNTANFTSVTVGSENPRLPSGSALIGVGVGPASNGLVPTADFEGDPRSGATTDVGFDQLASSSVPTVSGVAPSTMRVAQIGVVITGTNFGASQGSGNVIISPSDDVDDVNAIVQTITAWGATSITFNVVRGTLDLSSTLYLFVIADSSSSNADGFEVIINPAVAALAFGAGLLD